jgi:hypothetical protein
MVTFGFREFTNLLNKGKGVPEIAQRKATLDAVSVVLPKAIDAPRQHDASELKPNHARSAETAKPGQFKRRF